MTISNRVSIALATGFVVLGAACGLDWYTVIVGHLACGSSVLLLTFLLFALGWIGGGDAKVAAATAVWMGWDHLSEFGFVTSVLGGLLTLLILVLRWCPLPTYAFRAGWLARLHDADNGVPYGIALAVAGLTLYPQTLIWSSAA